MKGTNRRVAYVDVTPEVILLILQGLKVPLNSRRRFMVTDNPLPDDAVLHGIELIGKTELAPIVRLWVESAHFDCDRMRLPSPVLALEHGR